jgi:3-oxoadipate enol-lactonase
MSKPEPYQVDVGNGHHLAAWAVGPDGGPPVLLIAGAGGDHRGWRSIVPELCTSDEDRALFASDAPSLASHARVAVFDQRATGASESVPPATSARQLADDALVVGRALLGDRFAVVGSSMGGWAALQTVLTAPETVTALGLISTTAGGRGLTLPSDAVMNSSVAVVEQPDHEHVRESVTLGFTPSFVASRRPLIDLLVAEALATPTTEEVLAAQAAIFTSHDVADQLRTISVPTLVMCGSEDQHQPPENSRFLAEHIRGARLVMVEGAAHTLRLEAPGRVVDEVLSLLH